MMEAETAERPRMKKMFSWSDDNAPTIVDNGYVVKNQYFL